MTVLLSLSFFILFFIGVWLLLRDLFPIPSRAARTAVLSYHRKPKAPTLKTLSEPLAQKLQKYMPIGKYKRMRLENTLRAAHMEITSELYLARAAAPAVLYAAITIPFSLLVHPVIAAGFLIHAISMYRKEAGKAEKTMKEKRERINAELPHLAGTISEELKRSRNVMGMLTAYSMVCGKELRQELDITLADMHTGNQREALGRLSMRVSSLGLSQICRGLQSVLDGNDQCTYFQIISQTLENEQDQQTERYIQTLYNKIKPYSFMLLGCMLALLLVAAGIYIYTTSIQM